MVCYERDPLWVVDVKGYEMIERFLEKLIEELGATGMLVIGLYFILYRPLASMAKHIRKINDELGEIITLLRQGKTKIEATHGKD